MPAIGGRCPVFITGITLVSVSLACAATVKLTPTAPPSPTVVASPTQQTAITPSAEETLGPRPTLPLASTPAPTSMPTVRTQWTPSPISVENLAHLQTMAEMHMDATELAVADVLFSPDSAMLAALSGRGELKLWDTATGQVLLAESSSDSDYGVGYPELAFSPDGVYLASTGVAWADEYEECWGAVYLWDLDTQAEPARLLNMTHRSAMDVAFSPDGLTLAAGTQHGMGGGGHVLLWSVTTEELIHDIELDDWITGVTFSSAGQRIAAATYGAVILLEAATGETLMVVDAFDSAVWDVVFLPNDMAMVVRGSSSVVLIDLASSRYPPLIAGNSGEIADMALSSDGSLLATASWEDDAVTFWDTTEGQELFRLSGHNAPVLSVAISDDGRTLASLHADGAVLLWGVARR